MGETSKANMTELMEGWDVNQVGTALAAALGVEIQGGLIDADGVVAVNTYLRAQNAQQEDLEAGEEDE